MSFTPANVGRILIGVVLLFAAFALGGCLGGSLFPDSLRVSRMEMLADKVGSSIGIVVVALLIRRYLLHSFSLALACLVVTEILALLVILQFTGLTHLTASDVRFNCGWLSAMTWNVVLAFLLGAGIGHVWDRRAANNRAAPNGGPATPVGNSRATEGPPSVS
jgi:uncharacterized membrane protein